MGLAPYFDKAALSAAVLLRGFDRDAFASMLSAQVVEIAFDDQTASSAEGRVALELSINLISRLYPRVRLAARGAATMARELTTLSKAINPNIDIATNVPGATVRIAVGSQSSESDPIPTIYLGSDGWIAMVSDTTPLRSGRSANPFGAAAAACIGAANVFRTVFASQLTSPAPDHDLVFSILDLDPLAKTPSNPPLANVDIGTVHLVGAGAIGNGFLWTMTRAAGIRGELHVVDGEEVDDTNPQRYVLVAAADVGTMKVGIAARTTNASLRVVPHPERWGAYLSGLSGGWKFDRVAVAVDSARDRIAVQAALPRVTFNAWTQAGDLGVSRHELRDDSACLACLYLGNGDIRNEDELIATAIGMPERVRDVRRLLHLGGAVGREWIELIATAMGVQTADIISFEHRPLRAFYSEAICGGLVMRLQGRVNAGATEVPLAFQSALAGVLLAACVVADSMSVSLPTRGKAVLDLLRPLGRHLLVPLAKHVSGRCICQDPDYVATYMKRHEVGTVPADRDAESLIHP